MERANCQSKNRDYLYYNLDITGYNLKLVASTSKYHWWAKTMPVRYWKNPKQVGVKPPWHFLNSTLFLINSWKFHINMHAIFSGLLETPCPAQPPWSLFLIFFSGIAHWCFSIRLFQKKIHMGGLRIYFPEQKTII